MKIIIVELVIIAILVIKDYSQFPVEEELWFLHLELVIKLAL